MSSSIAKIVDKSLPEPKMFQQYYQNETLNFSFYKQHLEETGKEKAPLEFTCYCRTVSPAIMFLPLLCPNVEDLPHFAGSLLAIGRFNEIASNSRDEFRSIDDWNNGKFKFAIRRFGYIPNKPYHTLMEAAAVYFSPSKKTICFGIKAEAMICAYWKFKNDPYWGPIVRSIITYAVDMYEKHPGSEEYKAARYLFELAFAFNYFVKVNDEKKAGIPKSSTPLATYRYNDFQEFGTFRIYSGTTCPPQDAGFYMFSMPRTVTDIPYDHPVMFYIPHVSAACELSTTYAKEWIPKAALCVDMNFFLMKFVKMYEYMEQFLAEGNPQQPNYISFENMEEAEKYAKSVDLTKFSSADVRFCLKVKVAPTVFKAVIINGPTPQPQQPAQNVEPENVAQVTQTEQSVEHVSQLVISGVKQVIIGSTTSENTEAESIETKPVHIIASGVPKDVASKDTHEDAQEDAHEDAHEVEQNVTPTKESTKQSESKDEIKLEDVVSEITKDSKHSTESSEKKVSPPKKEQNSKSKKGKNNSPKSKPKPKATAQKPSKSMDWDDPTWD